MLVTCRERYLNWDILIKNRLLKKQRIMIESVVDLREQNRKALIRILYWPICYQEFGRKNIEGVVRCVSVIHLLALTKYLLVFFFLFMFQRCQLLVKMSTVRFTSSQNKKIKMYQIFKTKKILFEKSVNLIYPV